MKVALCQPFSSNLWHAESKLPAIITTVVVPSPASTSWALDSSTSLRDEDQGKRREREGREREGETIVTRGCVKWAWTYKNPPFAQ